MNQVHERSNNAFEETACQHRFAALLFESGTGGENKQDNVRF